MYSKVDLIENKKMGEIIKANQIKVRKENIRKYKAAQRQERFQIILLGLLFVAIVVIIGLIENMSF